MRAPLRPRGWLCLLVLTGCASPGARAAEQVSDAVDAMTVEAAFVIAGMDGMTASVTPEMAANAAAANAASFWGAGCFTYLIDGGRVTYELDECTGPFGLERVTGTVTVGYRSTASAFGLDVTTADLTVGDAAHALDVRADVATDGRNARVTTTSSGTGRRGHSVARTGTYELRWNASSRCAGIDGSWTTGGGSEHPTTVTNWQRCREACPAAGGSVSFAGPDGLVTVSYDGTRSARWSSATDGSGTVDLHCGE
ncbi:MAG: hypothetical protein KF729_02915 [Sandaracinaceae bacterium]|nr:hypothetical protein [Sandaracinaceae bacterium]